MLDKAKLGNRYNCFKCEAKFYDLNRPEPVCPKCSADQREAPSSDPRVAVMARYKGSRMTSDQAKPFREAFKVEETEEAEGDEAAEDTQKGAEAETGDSESEGADAPAAEDDAKELSAEDGGDTAADATEEEPAAKG